MEKVLPTAIQQGLRDLPYNMVCVCTNNFEFNLSSSLTADMTLVSGGARHRSHSQFEHYPPHTHTCTHADMHTHTQADADADTHTHTHKHTNTHKHTHANTLTDAHTKAIDFHPRIAKCIILPRY